MMKRQNLSKSILIIVALTLISACGLSPSKAIENALPTPTETALNASIIATPTNTIIAPTTVPTEEIIIDPNQWRNIGPWADAQSIFINPDSANAIYVWTPFQKIKSSDQGENWQVIQGIQNTNNSFYIDNLIMDPLNPSNLYAVQGLITNSGDLTSTGELFKSPDGGKNWQDLGIEIEIGALAINPKMSGIIYVGTKSKGILKSSDAGSTWEDANNGLAEADNNTYSEIPAITIDPQTPSIIYAGTNGNGIYRSKSDGKNWEKINSGSPDAFVTSIAIDPLNTATLYAVVQGEGIIKSTDSGANWVPINNGLTNTNIISIAIDSTTSTSLYAGASDSGIFKTTDGGDNWSEVFIPTKPMEKFCYQGIKDIVIDKTNPATVYAMTDGVMGKYLIKSTDNGKNWNVFVPNMYASYVESLAVSPQDPKTIFAGTRAGVFKSSNGGGKWTSTDLTDDISTLMFDPADPNTFYGISASDIYTSTNQGENWTKISPADYSYSVTSITASATKNIIIYAMDNQKSIISKSTDGGKTWGQTKYIKNFNTYFDLLLIDPLTPTTLYAESPYDGVFKSVDSGQNWKLINQDLTGLQILEINPKTPTNLYAGTKNDGVYKSTDSGETWKKINQGLDNLSIQALVIDPVTTTTLYIATPKGVYKSMDGGNTWEPFNTFMPNMSTTVETLFMDASNTNTLYAGTFMQGIYMIQPQK